jgi:hypothetical protein
MSPSRGKFRAPVLVYLMLGEALCVRDDGDDEDAWERTSKALEKVWFKTLTPKERFVLSYEHRVAVGVLRP